MKKVFSFKSKVLLLVRKGLVLLKNVSTLLSMIVAPRNMERNTKKTPSFASFTFNVYFYEDFSYSIEFQLFSHP